MTITRSTSGTSTATGKRAARTTVTVMVLALALAVSMVVAIGAGSVKVPIDTTVGVIWNRLTPFDVDGSWSAVQEQIVWQYRVPRVVLAAIVGGALALVGAILQAVVRNPLADPWVLGVSSGAGLGAVGLLLAGWISVENASLSIGAFIGAAVATTAVFLLSRQGGRMTPVRMVLTGVAMSYLFSAGTNYLVLTSEASEVFGVLYFLLGSVASAGWGDLALPLIVVLAGIVHALIRARALNALLGGDETATTLGVGVDRLRGELLLTTSVLTGVMVSVSGGIGFVGLVVPHVARLIVGAEHRRLLPVVVLCGATFLVLADLAARTLASPIELPIGVVTAVVGGPFFLWLMRRDGAARRGGLNR